MPKVGRPLTSLSSQFGCHLWGDKMGTAGAVSQESLPRQRLLFASETGRQGGPGWADGLLNWGCQLVAVESNCSASFSFCLRCAEMESSRAQRN